VTTIIRREPKKEKGKHLPIQSIVLKSSQCRNDPEKMTSVVMERKVSQKKGNRNQVRFTYSSSASPDLAAASFFLLVRPFLSLLPRVL